MGAKDVALFRTRNFVLGVPDFCVVDGPSFHYEGRNLFLGDEGMAGELGCTQIPKYTGALVNPGEADENRACKTNLPNADDAVSTSLNPTEGYPGEELLSGYTQEGNLFLGIPSRG